MIIIAIVFSFIAHIFVLSSHHDLIGQNYSIITKQKKKRIKLILKSNKKSNQVVSTEHKGRKEKSVKTKFLSNQNHKVERETVAKSIGKFKKAGKGSLKGQKIIQKRSTTSKKIAKIIKKKMKKGFTNKKKKISLADLSLNQRDRVEVKRQQTSNQQQLGLSAGTNGKSGLAQNNDFVEDIPLGDITSLNTTEYKYYGFYFRIKQKLEQHWGSTLRKKAKKLFKSGRRLPASENRITSLQIKLDNNGKIIDVFVKGTSGVNELDEAAIESFNKAGPFPNPPKGMIKNGYAQIEWGFVVKS